MEVGELSKLYSKKLQLKAKRETLIQEELKNRRREKVNMDQTSVKKGYIEKQKIIAKKKYETIVQKGRKVPIELQQNVNVNTFLSHSSNYEKILARTKEKIKFDDKLLLGSITAVNSFGISSKQNLINFTLEFDKQIVCQPRPFLIDIPEPQYCKQAIIVLPQLKEKQDCYAFEKITSLNLTVMASNQFINKFNNDKVFTKKLFQQNIKCFVKFELFKSKKFYSGLLRKGIAVFPIDSKKVPFCLQQTINSYPEYIEYLYRHYLCVTKTGRQQIFRLKTGDPNQILVNAQTIVYYLVAKLIERSKVKQNKLVRISIKTASSINFEVYQDSS